MILDYVFTHHWTRFNPPGVYRFPLLIQFKHAPFIENDFLSFKIDYLFHVGAVLWAYTPELILELQGFCIILWHCCCCWWWWWWCCCWSWRVWQILQIHQIRTYTCRHFHAILIICRSTNMLHIRKGSACYHQVTDITYTWCIWWQSVCVMDQIHVQRLT